MSIHSIHPDTHTHGLADDCPRCEEHAQEPFRSLDERNLRVLAQRVRNGDPARSVNERDAMDAVEDAYLKADYLKRLGLL